MYRARGNHVGLFRRSENDSMVLCFHSAQATEDISQVPPPVPPPAALGGTLRHWAALSLCPYSNSHPATAEIDLKCETKHRETYTASDGKAKKEDNQERGMYKKWKEEIVTIVQLYVSEYPSVRVPVFNFVVRWGVLAKKSGGFYLQSGTELPSARPSRDAGRLGDWGAGVRNPSIRAVDGGVDGRGRRISIGRGETTLEGKDIHVRNLSGWGRT
ncbi:hypothetical protein C8R47DRAFT_1064208 [Mycena vitilis]|nr:hypothetical protein C8R47DRAFT_1064208 [Mycena vitilis]